MPPSSVLVYIRASATRRLYVGVTGDLTGKSPRLTQNHEYCPAGNRTRRKQIKGWLQNKKIALIQSQNPEWRDPLPWRPAQPPSTQHVQMEMVHALPGVLSRVGHDPVSP